MKKLVIILIAVFILPAFVQAAEGIQEGLWEITTTTEMPSMPYKMPPTTIRHCYSKEDVKDQKNVVTAKDKDCNISDYNVSGNKVTWEMKCTGNKIGTYRGQTVFSTNSYSSTMKSETGGHKINMTTKAKRLGDCKK
jgi:hypothetical protein